MAGFNLTVEEIVSGGTLLPLALSFLGGLLTALTPCVYPLIPITIGLMGSQENRTLPRAILSSCLFLAGLAVVYSTLGFIAASTGAVFGSLTQKPWMVWATASLFLAMALSLLGLFEVRLPHSFNQWLAKRESTGWIGTFVLGAVSGLLAAPCSGPIVIGILGYVAYHSNPLYGFLLLFAFSLGLGSPFAVLGVFSQALRRIPKSGIWMEWIKHGCGLALLIAVLFLIHPIVSQGAFVTFLAFMILGVGIFVHQIFPARSEQILPSHRFARIFLVIVALGMLVPWGRFKSLDSERRSSSEASLIWLKSEKEGLSESTRAKKPILMDFFAEWCAACVELNEKTFSDREVQEVLRRDYVIVKVDATNMTPEVQALLEKYQVLALPTLIFVNSKGQVQRDLTVTEFVSPKEFLKLLSEASTKLKS